MLALGSSTDTTLVDALPYIDIQYNERDRQHALELIANECKVSESCLKSFGQEHSWRASEFVYP